MNAPSIGTPVFLAWSTVPGRSREIADALGGQARCFYAPWFAGRRRAPLRYLVDAARTALWLLRSRPTVVVVTNPPVFPALVAFGYAAVARIPVVLDSHPSAFGSVAKGDGVARRLVPITRALTRRACCVLVTTAELADQVRRWGGIPVVLHEAPPSWARPPWGLPSQAPARRDRLGHRPRILLVSRFAADEPVACVLDAAALVPELDVRVTGDWGRLPPALLAQRPPNVRFLGFLDEPDYVVELLSSDVVVALTTEPTSVMRAGCEAVWAGRPLVTSDWPACREFFPHALHCPPDPAALAAAFRQAVMLPDAAGRAATAAELQHRRWRGQLAELVDRLGPATRPGEARVGRAA